MALPKLNRVTYELELPSTGESVKYRPFLVKEQKVLMMAQESGEDQQIRDAFASIVKECTFEAVDPYSAPLFDIEYVFLRIRGKSVGEKVTLNLLCPDDNKTHVNTTINLEDVAIQMKEEHSSEIKLTNDIKIIMGYPTLGDLGKYTSTNESETVFDMIKNCIKEIHNGDEIHHASDVSDKEMEEFVESMSTDNFETVAEFFDTMPKLQHIVKVKNPKTKKLGEVRIEGMQSFFA